MADIALSLTMLAVIALAGGAVVLWRRGERRKAGLMAAAAAVALANVAIWSLPTPPAPRQAEATDPVSLSYSGKRQSMALL